MKTRSPHWCSALALLALATINSPLSIAFAQGTAFTYQGQLSVGGSPANGLYDFEFSLHTNAAGSGNQVGSTVPALALGVTNGLFITNLDFGAVFSGNRTWLAISVRSNGLGSYMGLTPLQELTPTPYAMFANTASNLSGTLQVAQLSGVLPLAQLPVGLVTNNESGVTLDNVTLGGNLTLPLPATVYAGGNSLLLAPGNNNFYAGPSAGISNGLGGSNTGLGAGSLQSNTNGTNNTAIGYQTLFNNTNGSYNVAIGERTMFQNTSGNDNTADGRHALEDNIVGNDNTANGFQALSSDTNGSYNTADGSGALGSLKYGSNDIAVGYQAGNNYTEGASSNIVIGNPGVAGDNNIIRLGSSQTETYIAGVINGNGGGLTNLPLLSNPGSLNFFAGQNSGNSTLSGSNNTGVGFGTLFSDTTGSYNTAQGVGALSANTSGSYGTAEGAGALYSNTSGADNTAVGFDALAANTTGANNTATGTDALFANTNGSQNTADGAGALFFNKTGGDNVAVGYQALLNNTNQSEDTAVGSQALLANTTGFQDTGIGYRALYGNTSGTYNTASGAFALNVSSIGSFDTASGAQALENNSTGSNNVANGFQALWQNTTGSQNTADGSLALLANSSGSGNIALGYQAGYNNLTGSDNIDIGNAGSTSDNNVIRIGSGQTATYLAGTIALDGSDTNNGLVYTPNSGLPGINYSQGPFLYGYDGGALGAVFPNTVCLSWDYSGNVWVSNNFSADSLTVRGNFAQINGANAANGAGPIDAYIGGNGSGSDVQIGSMNSSIANVAFYNWGNGTYMHIFCSAITIEGGADVAEPFEVSSPSGEIPQGSVVVIDEENPGLLKVSSQPYDTRVAGVLSGANGINPGIQMQQQGLLEGGKNVALTGRVYVLADAASGAIKPGDLLTTSATPGHAMKVSDRAKAQGAILGKAMTGLKEGQGMVLVLVTLQ